MDRSVSALINFGAIDCWTKPGTRVTGIALGAWRFGINVARLITEGTES